VYSASDAADAFAGHRSAGLPVAEALRQPSVDVRLADPSNIYFFPIDEERFHPLFTAEDGAV